MNPCWTYHNEHPALDPTQSSTYCTVETTTRKRKEKLWIPGFIVMYQGVFYISRTVEVTVLTDIQCKTLTSISLAQDFILEEQLTDCRCNWFQVCTPEIWKYLLPKDEVLQKGAWLAYTLCPGCQGSLNLNYDKANFCVFLTEFTKVRCELSSHLWVTRFPGSLLLEIKSIRIHGHRADNSLPNKLPMNHLSERDVRMNQRFVLLPLPLTVICRHCCRGHQVSVCGATTRKPALLVLIWLSMSHLAYSLVTGHRQFPGCARPRTPNMAASSLHCALHSSTAQIIEPKTACCAVTVTVWPTLNSVSTLYLQYSTAHTISRFIWHLVSAQQSNEYQCCDSTAKSKYQISS